MSDFSLSRCLTNDIEPKLTDSTDDVDILQKALQEATAVYDHHAFVEPLMTDSTLSECEKQLVDGKGQSNVMSLNLELEAHFLDGSQELNGPHISSTDENYITVTRGPTAIIEECKNRAFSETYLATTESEGLLKFTQVLNNCPNANRSSEEGPTSKDWLLKGLSAPISASVHSTGPEIIYHVVYPKEVSEGKQSVSSSSKAAKGTEKHVRKPRNIGNTEESDAYVHTSVNYPQVTRSGRIVNPPPYVLKDYYREDGDEDAVECSGNAENGISFDKAPVSLKTDCSTSKPRTYKCSSCDKRYIGQAGLDRHYRLNLDHYVAVNVSDSNVLHNSSVTFTDALKTMATASVSKHNSVNENTISTAVDDCDGKPEKDRMHFKRVGRKRKHSVCRKPKLLEVLSHYSDDELKETLPRFAKCFSAYEFLKAKSSLWSESATHPVTILYKQLEDFVTEFTAKTTYQLVPSSDVPVEENCMPLLNVNNPRVAGVLGVGIGSYRIRAIDSAETNGTPQSFHSTAFDRRFHNNSGKISESSSLLEETPGLSKKPYGNLPFASNEATGNYNTLSELPPEMSEMKTRDEDEEQFMFSDKREDMGVPVPVSAHGNIVQNLFDTASNSVTNEDYAQGFQNPVILHLSDDSSISLDTIQNLISGENVTKGFPGY